MDFVEAVLKDSVRVVCETPSLREQLLLMGAKDISKALVINTPSKELIASTMQKLQLLGFHFVDEPAGWPPAAIFQKLRDEGIVSGAVKTVSWTAPGKPIYGQA